MGFAVLTRNPLKWHPKIEPVLEFKGVVYVIPQNSNRFGHARYFVTEVEEDVMVKVGDIPTWSGDWQRAALRQIGATDEDITAAIVYARLMGETV